MKTPEEIRAEAKAFDESLPEDDNKSTSDFMELAYVAAYQSAQSSIEPEIEKRVEERMKEYSKWIGEKGLWFMSSTKNWNQKETYICIAKNDQELYNLYKAEKQANQ